MSQPTIIRFRGTADGFICVTTFFRENSLDAAFQRYNVNRKTNKTSLDREEVYSNEKSATDRFDQYILDRRI